MCSLIVLCMQENDVTVLGVFGDANVANFIGTEQRRFVVEFLCSMLSDCKCLSCIIPQCWYE